MGYLNTEEVSEIVRLYSECGLSMNKISDKTSVSRYYVKKVLDSQGIDIKKHPKKSFPRKDIITLYEKEMKSLKTIGKAYGVSGNTIKNRLISWGIDIRSSSDQVKTDETRKKISKNMPDDFSFDEKTIQKRVESFKKWRKNNPKQVQQMIEKMKRTKRIQSENGVLSKKHFSNNKSSKEVKQIYSQIAQKASKTKRLKYSSGELIPWNKGSTKYDDERIKKYSYENHYKWDENSDDEYDDKFYDPNYREMLLKRQNGYCIISNDDEDLVLHHIDENKKNSDSDNLVFLTRSIHTKLHNNEEFHSKCKDVFNNKEYLKT